MPAKVGVRRADEPTQREPQVANHAHDLDAVGDDRDEVGGQRQAGREACGRRRRVQHPDMQQARTAIETERDRERQIDIETKRQRRRNRETERVKACME